MGIAPTSEQQQIIDEPSHCVVIARPGSGKTATLAWKIRRIVPDLPPYRGIIAISYTNKASNELKRRALAQGMDGGSSFFGTIDRFYLSEIVFSFGKHLWGLPEADFEIREASELDQGSLGDQPTESDEIFTSRLGELYRSGTIVLEQIGYLAVQIIDMSLACRKYLKAKYSHVIIDEYQDCGHWQHELFIRLVGLGIIGVAVGDLDQSIYAFAHKDPRYLLSLTQNSLFVPYSLTQNHRSHVSIVTYATKLLLSNYSTVSPDEIRVFHKRIDGKEEDIAAWLSHAIGRFCAWFGVEERRRVGVLTKSRRTANIVHHHLTLSHKAVVRTSLDTITDPWGSLFRRILFTALDDNETKYGLVEQYLSVESNHHECRRLLSLLREIEDAGRQSPIQMEGVLGHFLAIAEELLPQFGSEKATGALRDVLSNEWQLDSFAPPKPDEVQLMTLHKAKGLEFDIVFHLDLYKYILPQYKSDDPIQDLNLHYVGITRAKKCCVLCTSSYRTKSDESVTSAAPSHFLFRQGLPQLRLDSPC